MSEGVPQKTGRSSYIGAPAAFLLDQACWFVNRAFDEHCYLVGSATERTTYRDVDVRLVMGDAKFDALFGASGDSQHTPFWQLICTSISLWLQQRTGLPVDFQIQSMSRSHKESGKRTPLGMFITDPAPAWAGISWVERAPWSTWEAKKPAAPAEPEPPLAG
jgi:hypothetical protein